LTDDLRAEMEATSKQNLAAFFDQWLRRPGYPEINATWTYDAAAREVVIGVTQGSRFGSFKFPLTVAVVDSAGTAHRATSEVLAVGDGAQRIRIPSPTRPVRVVLDPDVALLARLTLVEQ